MRTGAIVCFALTPFCAIAAVQNMMNGANRPEGFENLVGYAVGSWLLPFAFLIGGLILWEKGKNA